MTRNGNRASAAAAGRSGCAAEVPHIIADRAWSAEPNRDILAARGPGRVAAAMTGASSLNHAVTRSTMKRNRLRTFLAAADRYGGIPLAVIVVIALGVLTSIIPMRDVDQPEPDQQQVAGEDFGQVPPISSASGPRDRNVQ